MHKGGKTKVFVSSQQTFFFVTEIKIKKEKNKKNKIYF